MRSVPDLKRIVNNISAVCVTLLFCQTWRLVYF